MPTQPVHPDVSAVLRANAEFYRAFSVGDYTAMNSLWSARAPVVCIHPGAGALFGRDAVLDSWRQILHEPPPFEMRCEEPEVQLLGGVAFVTCYEGNGDLPAHLIATNVFVLEDEAWRLVHHHAGPLARPVAKPPAGSMN